jgi:hypothetical protein
MSDLTKIPNPVFQRIIGSGHGDCMQCTAATITNTSYENVPPFIEYKSFFDIEARKFFHSKGYYRVNELRNKSYYTLQYDKANKTDKPSEYVEEQHIKTLHKYEGINGLFIASVYSPKYFRPEDNEIGSHSVIIDKDYNIVFDPNPEYQGIKEYPLAKEIGYNGIFLVEVYEPITEETKQAAEDALDIYTGRFPTYLMPSIYRGTRGYKYICPACDEEHFVPIEPTEEGHKWGFNWKFDSPTFTPSLNHTFTPAAPEYAHKFRRCHHTITDGIIIFHGDNTKQSFNNTEHKMVDYYKDLYNK